MMAQPLPHANVRLATGAIVAESALFRLILADRLRADGTRPPWARAPRVERALLALQQRRRYRLTDAVSRLSRALQAGRSDC